MSTLVCLSLALAAQGPLAAPDPPAQHAMLEYRVVESVLVEPVHAAAFSGRMESMTTFELDVLLMALETGKDGLLPVPELGEISSSRIVSSPRIIARAGESASIESGDQTPIVEAHDGEEPRIDVTFRPRLRVDSLWGWEEDGLARLETEADYLGTRLTGTFRIRAGETAYFASARGGRAVVVFLTFRPVPPPGRN